MPEATLHAFVDHGKVGALLAADGGDAEEVLDRFERAGVDVAVLADDLQRDGARAFVKSWDDLLRCIADKGDALERAR
jgi:transaldolase